MKLSQIKKDGIVTNILDIYTKPERNNRALEQEIVKDNYLAWIPQYEDIIAKLPEKMLHSDVNVHIDIPKADGSTEYTERWYGTFDTKVVVMKKGSGYYTDIQATPIMDAVKDRITELQTSIEKLSSEKRSLKTFVDECLAKVTTTKQLHELWKDYPALAKHIPPEPVRTKKAQQTVLDLESKVDMFALNKRLTESLLEG